MKLINAFTLLLHSISFANAQNAITSQLVDNVTEISLKTNLKIIAGSQFEGRMAGSKGDSLAIQYISNWFGTHHLSKPYQSTTPFLQNVTLTHTDDSKSTLSIDGKGFDLNKQWANFDDINNFRAKSKEVVFAGYGISTVGFDELKGIDINGKMILLMPEFPNKRNGEIIIAKKDLPNEKQQIMSILSKKPLGVIFYDPDFKDLLEESKYQRIFEPYVKYPASDMPPFSGCLISSEIGNYLVGGSIDSVYQLILQTGQPHSFSTHKQITLSIKTIEEKKKTDNIVGIIKGTNEKLPCIVFTAHHDHEGKVGDSTYFGADDNGSGTATLLEISKILGDESAKGIRPKRTIVFVSTAAEEQGLIGSYYYVLHPIIPLSEIYCNINVDMLGRVDSFYSGKRADSNYVYCLYKDSSNKVFNTGKLEEISRTYGRLKLDTLYNIRNKNNRPNSLIARSDNFPFMKEGIPAIWFFSGFHKDYHRPTDSPDKINYLLLKRRTQLVLATLWEVANE